MTLIIPDDKLAQIRMKLAMLPAVDGPGKISLQIIFNCGSKGIVATMQFETLIQEEVRSC